MKNPFFRNVEFVKQNANKFLTDLGYTNIAYEGSELSLLFGGQVWFQCTRPNSKLVYTVRLRKQGNSLVWNYDRILNPEDAVTNVVRNV